MIRSFSVCLLATSFALTGCEAVQQAAHDVAAEEIAIDLIGESVWTGSTTWTFAGPEEFESMRIVSVNGDDNETRFVVDMELTDMYTGEKFHMRASVEYWHYGGGSDDETLGSVTCISFTRRL